MVIKSEELEKIGIFNSLQKSCIVAKLRDKKILIPIKTNGRMYTINFVNNCLLRGFIRSFENNWFISNFLNKIN